ncbi:MAG: drug resistance transporter, EmrB/QacA subfamily [Frankiales bacterium]|nr:drug resistance transporter, EmrB/QacA subfamily [Frankiales bacterium]
MPSNAPAVALDDARAASRRARLFTGLGVATFVAALDQTVVATALPRIVGELGGLTSYTWLAAAYLLTATAFTPLYGRLSDHFGRRAPYLTALALFTAGSLAATAAQTMGQLIAARAVQGLGAGGVLTLAVAVIGDELEPRQRARYQGWFGGLFALASLVGPPIGGVLTDGAGWRWVFAVNVPLSVVAAVLLWRLLPRSRAVEAPVDYRGAALLVASVSCLLLAVTWGGVEKPWGSATVLALITAGAGLLIAFVAAQHRTAAPIMPVRLFRDRTFALSCAAGFCVGAGMFGAIFFVPLFLQVARHASASAAGRSLVVLTLALVVAAGLSGRIVSRTGRLRAFPIAGTALVTSGFWLLSGVSAGTSGRTITASLLLIGFGIGLVMQVLVIAVQHAAPRAEFGAATSAAGFFRSIGGTIGVAILGAVLSNRLGTMSEAAATVHRPGASLTVPATAIDGFVSAMGDAFLVATIISAIGFVLTLFLPPIRLAARTGTVPSDHSVTPPGSRHLGRNTEQLDPHITNS